jgi:hypothetical protein
VAVNNTVPVPVLAINRKPFLPVSGRVPVRGVHTFNPGCATRIKYVGVFGAG